jgi:hypothetical protein
MAKYEMHDFYCLACGHKTLPVHRKQGKMHGAFHRKRLWCYHCKQEINCVEVRNDEEKEIFMEAFNNGEYQEEAAESLCACRPSCCW